MDPIQTPGLHGVLADRYGSNCHRSIQHLTVLIRKTAVSVAGLIFLLKCRRYNVMPNFIRQSVKFACLGPHLERVSRSMPHRMLRAAIRDVRA